VNIQAEDQRSFLPEGRRRFAPQDEGSKTPRPLIISYRLHFL